MITCWKITWFVKDNHYILYDTWIFHSINIVNTVYLRLSPIMFMYLTIFTCLCTRKLSDNCFANQSKLAKFCWMLPKCKNKCLHLLYKHDSQDRLFQLFTAENLHVRTVVVCSNREDVTSNAVLTRNFRQSWTLFNKTLSWNGVKTCWRRQRICVSMQLACLKQSKLHFKYSLREGQALETKDAIAAQFLWYKANSTEKATKNEETRLGKLKRKIHEVYLKFSLASLFCYKQKSW